MANQFYGYSSPSPSASTLHRYLDSDAASQSQSHLLQQLHPSAAAAAAAAASLIKRPSQGNQTTAAFISGLLTQI